MKLYSLEYFLCFQSDVIFHTRMYFYMLLLFGTSSPLFQHHLGLYKFCLTFAPRYYHFLLLLVTYSTAAHISLWVRLSAKCIKCKKWKCNSTSLHLPDLHDSRHMGELAHHYIHIQTFCWDRDSAVNVGEL